MIPPSPASKMVTVRAAKARFHRERKLVPMGVVRHICVPREEHNGLFEDYFGAKALW
jgi:hypothetical protein